MKALKYRFLNQEYSRLEKAYLSFLTLIVILPILAPILSEIGFSQLSKPIYFIYSFLCHQFDTRSIHVGDFQHAWCARDFGIWSGIFVSAWSYKLGFIKDIRFKYLILLAIPIALDGGIQTIATLNNLTPSGQIDGDILYSSNNLFRFITGSLFGVGVGLFISQFFVETEFKIKYENTRMTLQKISIIMALLFLTYFSSVLLWQITGVETKPTNILDSEPKLQEEGFFIRRANGECPNEGSLDLINFNCFF